MLKIHQTHTTYYHSIEKEIFTQAAVTGPWYTITTKSKWFLWRPAQHLCAHFNGLIYVEVYYFCEDSGINPRRAHGLDWYTQGDNIGQSGGRNQQKMKWALSAVIHIFGVLFCVPSTQTNLKGELVVCICLSWQFRLCPLGFFSLFFFFLISQNTIMPFSMLCRWWLCLEMRSDGGNGVRHRLRPSAVRVQLII